MVKELTAGELNDRLKNGDQLVVLDVREPWELNICALPGAKHIPMRDVPARVVELPKDMEIVVMCHHGGRSMQIANYLARNGFEKLYNLSGGIAAWSRDVDPSTPTY